MDLVRGLVLFAQISVVFLVCARLAGFKLPAALSWTVVLLAYAASGVFVMVDDVPSWDGQIFWNAGRDVLGGVDPYARPEFLNPPTALPIYVLFALLPLSQFLWVWKIAAFVGYGVIVPACKAAFRTTFEENRLFLSRTDLALLAGAVVISVSVRFGIRVGQIPILISLAAVGALAMRDRNRPVGAGIFLTIMSIKPNTMLPFLLLFPPKTNIKTWATMIVSGFLLTFLVVHPFDLLDTLLRNLQNIRNASLPGAVNDYSFEGSIQSGGVDFLALDYAIYHLGFRDRILISAVHFTGIVSLALFLAWQIYRRPAINFASAASIVACLSMLFLYHRQYDAIILVVPLVYAFSMALAVRDWRRWIYRACTLGIIGVLSEPMAQIGRLIPFAQGSGILNRMVEAIVLPLGTWVIVAIAIALAIVERKGSTGHLMPAPDDCASPHDEATAEGSSRTRVGVNVTSR
jgi:Glycosyltransferase family 87